MTSENKQTESPAAVVVSYLQSKLLAAANYIDVLGGDSKSYRVAIATELQAQPADAPYPPLPATEVLDSYVSHRTGAEVYVDGYTAEQMHAYVDLDRASMTAPQAQPADALDAARYRVIRSMHDEMHPRSLVCLLEGHSWSSVADSATELDKFCDEVDAMAAAHAALAKHKQL